MAGERIGIKPPCLLRFGLTCLLLLANIVAPAQDWNRVHKVDDAKWAKATGLDPSIVHKLWKAASTASDEKLDESRIANLDLQGLSIRRDVLLATYAGEKNCLTITVFRRFSETVFRKLWSVEQSPEGAAFCDNDLGAASTDANDGVVTVSVPRSRSDGEVVYTVYAYDWNGITYKLAGQKDVRGR
jgi:hypothetical protein